jgi:hypothetical protein
MVPAVAPAIAAGKGASRIVGLLPGEGLPPPLQAATANLVAHCASADCATREMMREAGAEERLEALASSGSSVRAASVAVEAARSALKALREQ